MTPFFQSDSRLLARLRDLTFHRMKIVPYLHREMVRTLAGLKTGVFRSATPAEIVNGDRGTPVKVLILGGYGTFGGRLARLLVGEPALTLLIAGRSRDKAAAFCAGLRGAAECQPLAFDRDGDVDAQIARLAPDLIVDASGPFQSYGDDPYRVVQGGTGARHSLPRSRRRLRPSSAASGSSTRRRGRAASSSLRASAACPC